MLSLVLLKFHLQCQLVKLWFCGADTCLKVACFSVMRMRLASPTHFVESGLIWKKRFEDHGMATPLVVATGHYQSHRDKNTVHEQKLRNC